MTESAVMSLTVDINWLTQLNWFSLVTISPQYRSEASSRERSLDRNSSSRERFKLSNESALLTVDFRVSENNMRKASARSVR